MPMINIAELREQNRADTERMRELLSSRAPGAEAEWKALHAKVAGRDSLIVGDTADRPRLGNEEDTPPTDTTRALIRTPEYRAGFRNYLTKGTMESRAALSVRDRKSVV